MFEADGPRLTYGVGRPLIENQRDSARSVSSEWRNLRQQVARDGRLGPSESVTRGMMRKTLLSSGRPLVGIAKLPLRTPSSGPKNRFVASCGRMMNTSHRNAESGSAAPSPAKALAENVISSPARYVAPSAGVIMLANGRSPTTISSGGDTE